jgi:two-component system response regulator AtoC
MRHPSHGAHFRWMVTEDDTASAGRGNRPTMSIIGISGPIERARGLIRKLACARDATVLITGESGTGKELAARALHDESSRADRPFVDVACTTLPSTLLESELFGHERGAFTDARTRHLGLLDRAAAGTLFLDEIGDMHLLLQAKLLRVLEQKRYRRVGGTEDIVADVRIVAATNVDLLAAVRKGRFREDLYYRIAGLVLHMPSLRDRREDVPLLAQHFVAHYAARWNQQVLHLTTGAVQALVDHDWPGNVRELRNVIERAMILCESCTIDAGDLELSNTTSGSARELDLPRGGVDMKSLERALVQQALERTRGNVTRAARLLGMTRDQVRYRIHKFALHSPFLQAGAAVEPAVAARSRGPQSA